MQNCAQCGTPLPYGTTTCPGCGHFVAYNSPSWGGYNPSSGGPAANQDAFQPPSQPYNPASPQGQVPYNDPASPPFGPPAQQEFSPLFPPYGSPSQQGEFSPSFPPQEPFSRSGIFPYTGPIPASYNQPSQAFNAPQQGPMPYGGPGPQTYGPSSQPLNSPSQQGQFPYAGPGPQTYGPPSQILNPQQEQTPYNGPGPQTYGPPSQILNPLPQQGPMPYGGPGSQAYGPPSQLLNPLQDSPILYPSYTGFDMQPGVQQQSPQPAQSFQDPASAHTSTPYGQPPMSQAQPLPFAAQGQTGTTNSNGNARQGLSKTTIVSVVVLALLLIGSGISLIFYTTVARPAQLHAQASATAGAIANNNAHASATANAYVTATAKASATVQAQAQATANTIEAAYTKSTNQAPTLTSTMASQDQANWDIYNAVGGGGCAFVDGALHSSIAQKQFYVPCFAQATNFNNFVFEVEMTILKGDEGGLIFRANDANSKYYYFRVGRDGIYSLNVSKDDKHSTPIAFDSSPAIKTGAGQMNLITVIAKGSTIYLYINKRFVSSTTDKSYNAGKIGVFAGDNRNPTDVAFSNARVWQL